VQGGRACPRPHAHRVHLGCPAKPCVLASSPGIPNYSVKRKKKNCGWHEQDSSATLRSVKCGAARSSALRRDSAACRAAAGGGSGAARFRRLHRRLPRAVGAGGRGGDRDGARKQRRELRDDPRRGPRDAAGVLRLHQQGDGRRACRCWAQGSAARPAGGGCAWPPARGLTVCARGSQERLLFNCPEGTQRLMSQNKLKLSNKVSFAAGDRAGALLCSLRAEGGCGCPRAAPPT
jgi:hypothetical protein